MFDTYKITCVRKNGRWFAEAKGPDGTSDIYGQGDSSVEAHCDLLERLAAKPREKHDAQA